MDFGKKGPKKEGSEDQKMAKMKALKGLRDAMSKSDGEGLDGMMKMKKVTVAAPDTKDLKKGLDKAKDLVDKMPMDNGGEEPTPDNDELDAGNDYQDEEESPAEEASESAEDEVLEDMDSADKIDALVKKLQEKKASLNK